MSSAKVARMANRRVKADQLGAAIEDILKEYGDEVEANLREVTKAVGKKGAQALRNESKDAFPNGSGEYAKGWTSTEVRYPHYNSVYIHNKLPGLPHLLEHGHVLKRGGRQVGFVQGREHIAPVEEQIMQEFTQEAIKAI